MHVFFAHTACICLMDQISLGDMIFRVMWSLAAKEDCSFARLPSYFATFDTFYSFFELCIVEVFTVFPFFHRHHLTCSVFFCWILSTPLWWTFKAFSRFWLYELWSVDDFYFWTSTVEWQWEKREKWKKKEKMWKITTSSNNGVAYEKINSLCNLQCSLLSVHFNKWMCNCVCEVWCGITFHFAVCRCVDIRMNLSHTHTPLVFSTTLYEFTLDLATPHVNLIFYSSNKLNIYLIIIQCEKLRGKKYYTIQKFNDCWNTFPLSCSDFCVDNDNGPLSFTTFTSVYYLHNAQFFYHHLLERVWSYYAKYGCSKERENWFKSVL